MMQQRNIYHNCSHLEKKKKETTLYLTLTSLSLLFVCYILDLHLPQRLYLHIHTGTGGDYCERVGNDLGVLSLIAIPFPFPLSLSAFSYLSLLSFPPLNPEADFSYSQLSLSLPLKGVEAPLNIFSPFLFIFINKGSATSPKKKKKT